MMWKIFIWYYLIGAVLVIADITFSKKEQKNFKKLPWYGRILLTLIMAIITVFWLPMYIGYALWPKKKKHETEPSDSE